MTPSLYTVENVTRYTIAVQSWMTSLETNIFLPSRGPKHIITRPFLSLGDQTLVPRQIYSLALQRTRFILPIPLSLSPGDNYLGTQAVFPLLCRDQNAGTKTILLSRRPNIGTETISSIFLQKIPKQFLLFFSR